MKKGDLDREQAIAIVGAAAIDALERENCEPTGRVGYNGGPEDDLSEWSASVRCKDQNGTTVTVTAYYYTTNEEDQLMADCDWDGGVINWEIEGYEVY